jgi:hypothetical protein
VANIAPGEDSRPTDDGEEAPLDEASIILEVISECIKSLFRLGILVRKAGPADRFKRALQMSSKAFTESPDIDYVKEKYPKTASSGGNLLAVRLGKAIAKRRLFIKYSRDHKSRLAFEDDAGDIDTRTEQQSSKATTFHVDMLQDPTEVEEDDDLVSFVSTSTMSDSLSVLKLPQLGSLSNNAEPFECPICFTLQSFKREKSWRYVQPDVPCNLNAVSADLLFWWNSAHAFHDLRAYVCTAGGKECESEYFGDRNTWFEHELQYHRSQYNCPLCQDQLESWSGFKAHIMHQHGSFPDQQLQSIWDVSRQAPIRFKAEDCPFCDDWGERIRFKIDAKGKQPASMHMGTFVSVARFKRHIALHQEQLAIFAVPRATEDGLAVDEGSGQSSSFSNDSPRPASHEGLLDVEWTPKYYDNDRETRQTKTEELAHLRTKLEDLEDAQVHERFGPGVTKNVQGWADQQWAELGRLRDEQRAADEKQRREEAKEAVERYKQKELERMAKIAHEKEENEKEYKRRLKEDLISSGLDEKQIADIMGSMKVPELPPADITSRPSNTHMTREAREKEENEKEYKRRLQEDLIMSGLDEMQVANIMGRMKVPELPPAVSAGRRTYTRMARRHISIETLRAFRIEYELDLVSQSLPHLPLFAMPLADVCLRLQDPEYILIKRWVPEWEQDRLWEHSKLIRSKRPKVTLQKEDSHHGELEVGLVRKMENRKRSKSPNLLMYLAASQPPDY